MKHFHINFAALLLISATALKMRKKSIFLFLIALMSISVSAMETLQVRLGKDACALGDTLSYSLALTSNEPVSSRIVYVEWLTPEGFVVDRQVRRLENGKVEGSVPVLAKNYSGLYEFRAYTRYMLRGGHYFSKVVPVYELKDGQKCIKQRMLRGEYRTDGREFSFDPRFRVKPEHDITIRGMLYNPKKPRDMYGNVDVTLSTDGYSGTVKTDSTGQFEFHLGDKKGTFDATFVYPNGQKDMPSIVLDNTFAPGVRKYTADEVKLLDGYTILKPKEFLNENNPGKVYSTKQILSDLMDMSGGGRYFYFNSLQQKTDLDYSAWNPLFLAIFEEWKFAPEPIRYALANKPMNSLNLLTDKLDVFDDGARGAMDDYEYLIITTDKSVCKRLNYGDYPPQTRHLNRRELDNGDMLTVTGANHFSGSGPTSVVVVYVPYAKTTPLSERKKNKVPNIRYAVIQGLTE